MSWRGKGCDCGVHGTGPCLSCREAASKAVISESASKAGAQAAPESASKAGAQGETFARLLEQKLEVFRKKNADYAGGLGRYHNFEHAARLIQSMVRPEHDPVDVVFLVMLGIKTGRLIALKQAGKTPNNESVLDSHGDLTTYCGIWEAREADKEEVR